jgi:ATP-dependent Lon protease
MEERIRQREVPVERLRWRCDPEIFGFETTDEIEVYPEIIGQHRAVDAIRLGLDIDGFGYNIFLSGLVGTGRKTAVRRLLEEVDRSKRIPDDKLYVNNFKNSDRPRLIRLPAGKGREFKRDMKELIEALKREIPAVFESEYFEKKKKEIVDRYKSKENRIIKDFEKDVAKDNFTLIQLQVGPFTKPDIVPVIDGKPISLEKLGELVEKKKFKKKVFKRLEAKYSELFEEMEDVLKKVRGIEKELRDELRALNSDVVAPIIKRKIRDLKEEYKTERVCEYLDEVAEDIIENIERFQERPETKPHPEANFPHSTQDPFLVYQVNLIVDNSGAKKSPVVFETSPTYINLFGSIERVLDVRGHWTTDFMHIKAGSFLQADGGYLIIEALDALIEVGVWPTLKRTLRNRKLEIQNYDPFYLLTTPGLKPEPIDCDVKVVMVGDLFLYHLLYNRDEDFKKIFKIRADFDSVMDVESEDSIRQYANFIKKIVVEEGLMPFDKRAVSAVVEYGVRLAGRQNKLSTQFNTIADCLREANYWARKDGSPRVTESHVKKAIAEGIERSRLIEEKIQEMIEEGLIMIDVEGEVVGQVNGLSIYETGGYVFGRPSRITARVGVGSAGIIDIEREAELSGKIHSKGVLILTGFFRSRYAQDKPLAMNASICFEQSYSGVEGDSASSSEVYAIMSALSGVPLRQDIAVTGSVNQKGEIQSIGGVNQKIEGFFDVCKAKGLTGTQGVIIPHQNVKDLILRDDVVEAISKGMFHVYSIKNIDEGIEILTGRRAGKMLTGGRYEEETVNALVDSRLREFAERWKTYRMGAGDGE